MNSRTVFLNLRKLCSVQSVSSFMLLSLWVKRIVAIMYNAMEAIVMKSMKGVVSKIRVLKMSKTPLVRFSLDNENCLIAAHSLNFLADVDDGMQIVVAGDYNDRKQFVVKKYTVIGKTKIMIEFEKSIAYN